MKRIAVPGRVPLLRVLAVLPVLLALAACSSPKVVFVYPDESVEFRYQDGEPPAVFLDEVTDMRPPVQREGEGTFFKITYPGDGAWEAPIEVIYAEALVQDLEQTNMMAVVPLRGQARYVLSADVLSMSCRLERSPLSFLVTGGIGAAAGLAVGGDASHRAKLATALAVAGMVAIPVPTRNHAECEVRLSLKDPSGDILWQESCIGEYEARKAITPTARVDQDLVNDHLVKAVKRANTCLLGKLRLWLMERQPGS